MTLHVSRDGDQVTIHANTGLDLVIENSQISEASVTEHYAHVRHFWGQLGAALQEAEDEASEAGDLRQHTASEEHVLGEGEIREVGIDSTDGEEVILVDREDDDEDEDDPESDDEE